MQLPPDEEIVMVSGHPPTRAKKLRYYEDANFKDRVLEPPVLAADGYADCPAPRPDDWTGRIAAPPAASAIPVFEGFEDEGGPRRQPELDAPEAAPMAAAADEIARLDGDGFDDEGATDR